jgi:hypothetical protein
MSGSMIKASACSHEGDHMPPDADMSGCEGIKAAQTVVVSIEGHPNLGLGFAEQA